MSQPRMRNVMASDERRARPSFSVAKSSEVSAAYTGRPNQETRRSRSKNKIPKSVRYDLENALVSLCDVWFEEIKPHLVRNNIKLHVHGSSACGDQERPLPNVPPTPLVHPSPSCSYPDPGAASDHPRHRDASYTDCCSTPPAASRGPCPRRRALRQRHPLAPVPSLPQTPHDCTQNCEEKQLKRPRTRRKHRRSPPQAQSSWRVPRLCRTYSVPSPAATGTHMRIASRLPPQPLQSPQPPHDDYFRLIVPRRKTVMKNKSTQTEQPLVRPVVKVDCHGEELELKLNTLLLKRHIGSRSPETRSPGARSSGTLNPGVLNPGTRSPRMRIPRTRSSGMRVPRTCSSGMRIPRTRSPGTRSPRTRSSGTRSPGTRSPRTRSPRTRSPGTRSPRTRSSGTRSPGTRSPRTRSPRTRSPGTRSPGMRSSVFRSPGKISHGSASPALSPPRQSHYWLTRPKQTVAKELLALFQDDLIDIIGKGNDKRLRLLYSSPDKDCPSSMTLDPLHIDQKKTPGGLKQSPPWR